jgi:hypothetical protein
MLYGRTRPLSTEVCRRQRGLLPGVTSAGVVLSPGFTASGLTGGLAPATAGVLLEAGFGEAALKRWVASATCVGSLATRETEPARRTSWARTSWKSPFSSSKASGGHLGRAVAPWRGLALLGVQRVAERGFRHLEGGAGDDLGLALAARDLQVRADAGALDGAARRA